MNKTKSLGHEKDENSKKPKEEKVETIVNLNLPEKLKRVEVIPRSNTIHGKIPTKTIETSRPIEKITEKE